MKENIKILYKYGSWDNPYSKNILIKNQVYFADPNSFNDPFDCRNDSIYNLINLEEQIK